MCASRLRRPRCYTPKTGLRSSPIAAVVLTSGEVDSIAGLLSLRERQPFHLIATERIHAVLDANPHLQRAGPAMSSRAGRWRWSRT